MGDMSVEPSMEEILSSIKRIIAEEGESTQARGRRGRSAPPPADPAAEEVLELSDPMPVAEPAPAPPPAFHPATESQPAAQIERPAPAQVRPAPQPHASIPSPASVEMPAPASAPVQAQPQPARPSPVSPAMTEEPILSQRTAAASLGSLEALSKMLVRPDPDGDGTLEGLVREMLRPMLREWLDAHLPEMVETMVAREIAKITSQMR